MFRALRQCACLAVFLVLNLFGMAQQQQSSSPDQIWNQLVAGNHRFATGKSAPHDLQAQRESLTKTQHPQVAVLSCSALCSCASGLRLLEGKILRAGWFDAQLMIAS